MKPCARACVKGNSIVPELCGVVKFYQHRDGVLVEVNVSGLPESKTNVFAIHIHEGGNCSGNDFHNVGSHYNPNHQMHPNHAGDLPPLFSCKGKAYMSVLTDRFTLEEITGKSVIIHSLPDDFTTQPAGNAGSKIGCGVINIV